MSVREQLNSIAEKRILVLDGAMGSMLQSKGCNDELCLVNPEAIGAIHDAYLEAGADIIETCSFNSTSISLSDYGLADRSYEISAAAAKIARKSADKFSAAGKPRFVAGSMGPTAKGASLYPDINDPGKRSICWDELEAAYYENARGLLDGGADILLIETVFDTLNAKAALFAVSRLLASRRREERSVDVPVIISAAVSGDSGRLLSGQSLEAFCVSVLHAEPFAIGLNCSSGAEKLLPSLRLLAKAAPCFVCAYPNAGLPDKHGHYDETPELFSANIENYLKEGLVNIVGGCCGSAPEHIAAVAKKTAGYKPRNLPGTGGVFFAGLDVLSVADNVVRVRDAKNAAAQKEFLKLVGDGEYEDAVDAARDMVDDGAAVVNLETDDKDAAGKFLDFALMNPYAAKAPFMIISSRFDVLETALKRLQGRGFAGPVSLKDGEAEFLRRAELIRRYGAAAVVTLIDGQERDDLPERKIEIARRIYQLLEKSGYPVENVVFDGGGAYAQIRDNCPDAILSI